MESQVEKEKHNPIGAVMVVGAGISGIQAALDLANSGFRVYLVEKGPAIGGKMAQLDKTFPTNDCSMCILSPKLTECERNINIKIITLSTIESIHGEAGHFEVSILKRPRYVDEELCNNCGICIEYCPLRIPDLYNQGLSTTKCLHVHFPQAIPAVPFIDPNHCLFFNTIDRQCMICAPTCKIKAINLRQEEETLELEVGAIILAIGYETFDPAVYNRYGYGKFENVITSLDFERILSASGPFRGHIQRPSDGKEPQRIAWLQCIGSRDLSIGKGYCSAVCCMYATKQSIIAKEHLDTIEPTIFFMDMRAYGKDFHKYWERAKKQYGVRYIRSKVASIAEIEETKNLRLAYVLEDDNFREEEYDLVVLSVGLGPAEGLEALSDMLGVEVTKDGFLKTQPLSPISTTRPGIYVCGVASGPKDIPDSVVQASAAASRAGSLLASARGTLMEMVEPVEEIDVRDKEPRIGAIICNCGSNIASVVDVKEVVRYAKELPSVVFATDSLFACSKDSLETLKEKIREYDLNRIVVAACTPRTHEYLFQENIGQAGLNAFLFEMANIREHCSWVHSKNPVMATEKAKDLVRIAVAKGTLMEPLERRFLEINHDGLVVGGGLAGMVSALSLADLGFKVHLVEKSGELGGAARKMLYTLEGHNIQEYIKALEDKVLRHPLIHSYVDARITATLGSIGNFETTIESQSSGEIEEISHGVVIIATGAEELKPEGFYLYGNNPNVLTLMDLEEIMAQRDDRIAKATTFAIIQCVGSRCEERPYCSRYCCSHALKSALRIKELNPGANVFILYRDIMAYGLMEDYYTKAAKAGVVFSRFNEAKPPQVYESGSKIMINYVEPILEESMELAADMLILSSATVAPKENNDLSKMFKVPLNSEGFFLEAHAKLRPVDLATDGIFLTGLAHYPKHIDEIIAQAEAAAARAATVLSKPVIKLEAATSEVVDDVCDGCAYCVETCPFHALTLIEYMKDGQVKKVVEANESLCKGCGNCQATCPKRGIYIKHFRLDQLERMVEAALG